MSHDDLKRMMQAERDKRATLLTKRPAPDQSEPAFVDYDSSDSSSSESEMVLLPPPIPFETLPRSDPLRNTLPADLLPPEPQPTRLPAEFLNEPDFDELRFLRELNLEIATSEDFVVDTSVLFEGLEERRQILQSLRSQLGQPRISETPVSESEESSDGEIADSWRDRSITR